VTDHQTFTISQCTFHADSALRYGGGFHGYCPGAQSVVDCYFRDCYAGNAGGAIASFVPFHRIAGCLIERCHADSVGGGIAICNQVVTPIALTIEETRIIECSAGDADLGSGSGGGIYFRLATAGDTLRSLTLCGCRARRGGGLNIEGGLSVLRNCTIVDNEAVIGAGVRVVDACELGGCGPRELLGAPPIDDRDRESAPIENLIIAFNHRGEGLHCQISDPLVGCTDIFGNEGGDWIGVLEALLAENGNICADPLFCTIDSGVLMLAEASPCAPFSPPNPECDLIGAWPIGCQTASVENSGSTSAPVPLVSSQPSPFRDAALLCFCLPPGPPRTVTLAVHDAAGRRVRLLCAGGLAGGWHTERWDGCDALGRRVPSGAYFWVLRHGGESHTLRTVLIR
jgi:hypothetical protein